MGEMLENKELTANSYKRDGSGLNNPFVNQVSGFGGEGVLRECAAAG